MVIFNSYVSYVKLPEGKSPSNFLPRFGEIPKTSSHISRISAAGQLNSQEGPKTEPGSRNQLLGMRQPWWQSPRFSPGLWGIEFLKMRYWWGTKHSDILDIWSYGGIILGIYWGGYSGDKMVFITILNNWNTLQNQTWLTGESPINGGVNEKFMQLHAGFSKRHVWLPEGMIRWGFEISTKTWFIAKHVFIESCLTQRNKHTT